MIKSKLVLSVLTIAIASVLTGCPSTPTVVPDYPYSNTLHVDDGNGDLYYTVYRTPMTGDMWYFKIDVFITDGTNDDDCIYAYFEGPDYFETGTVARDEACAVAGKTPTSKRAVWDWVVRDAELPYVDTIYLCRNKEWYGDPCVGRGLTFTNEYA